MPFSSDREPSASNYIVIAAHPDDEVIGLGIFLREWAGRVLIVHATDGSPEDLKDAQAAGFDSAAEYAQARRSEAEAAVALVGINPSAIVRLHCQDQQLSFQLPELARELRCLFDSVHPTAVYVHPYEGGHPDHDAISFAAAAAVRLCSCRPALFEFSSYHAGSNGWTSGEFLNAGQKPCYTKFLTCADRTLKRRMFNEFVTQQNVLGNFQVEVEKIRTAPDYVFAQAPHPGALLYEHYDWRMTGALWRSLAAEAAVKLGL